MDVEHVLSQLSLEEKASLVAGHHNWYTATIKRLGIDPIMMTDGPSGLRKTDPTATATEFDRAVPAVAFPTAALTAATFNPQQLYALGQHLGEAARSEQVSVLLGPGVNLKRSPLAGRNFEYFSEDPLVAGELGSAYVKGVQSQNVGVAVKHFAANNRENQRFTASSDLSPRALRELYLRAFERIVKQAQPDTIMTSYNRINGVLSSQNHRLLRDILRDEWGFHGAIMSDWGAVADHPAALRAGLDLEMPGKGDASTAEIVTAIQTGTLDEGTLNNAVRHVLRVIAARQPLKTSVDYDHAAHHAFARSLAAEGIVLLKNQDQELPLPSPTADHFLIVGDLAAHPRFQGDGSSRVNPYQVTTPLAQAQALGITHYVQGYRLDEEETDASLLTAAVAAATTAQQVVVFAGYPADYESEGFDKSAMVLPENQTELIGQLAEVNPHVTVVLQNGSPVEMPWIDTVAAVVETYLPGEAGGEATWDILTGAVNPSGHLAETFPVRLQDTPMAPTFGQDPKHEVYHEDIFMGYRYYDTHEMPVLFPFGHGLSYTTFEYDHLTVVPDADQVTVSVVVTNTGDRVGQAVPQLYVANHASRVPMPTKELRAFTKVAIAPGESQTVTFTLQRRDFSWWREDHHAWQADSGDYEIMIGESAHDIRVQAKVTMHFQNAPDPITTETYLAEIVADDELRTLFYRDVIEPLGAQDSPATPLTPDDHGQVAALHSRLFLNIPLRGLIGLGVPEPFIHQFLQQANAR